MLTNNKTIERSKSFEVEKLEDSLLIIPIENDVVQMDKAVYMEGIAPEIWDMLEGEIAISKLIEYILNKYNVQREEVQNDIMELLETLLSVNLITLK